MALPALPESGTRKETGGGSVSGFEQSLPLLLLTVYRVTLALKVEPGVDGSDWSQLACRLRPLPRSYRNPVIATLPRSQGFGMRAGLVDGGARTKTHTKGRALRALVSVGYPLVGQCRFFMLRLLSRSSQPAHF